MSDDTMTFEVNLRSITVEVFQEVDALLAEIEREREQGEPTFHTGGIVPPCPDVLAHLIVDSVLPRHVVESMGASHAQTSSSSAGPIIVETRWMPRTYDEVREVDRALVRRDRATARRIGKRSSRPRATARQVAESLETASKITSDTGE